MPRTISLHGLVDRLVDAFAAAVAAKAQQRIPASAAPAPRFLAGNGTSRAELAEPLGQGDKFAEVRLLCQARVNLTG